MDYEKTAYDDIIFQHKNKEYGAYVLRRQYPGRLVKAFLLSLALLLLLIYCKDIAQLFHRSKGKTVERSVEVVLTPGELNEQQFNVPPPPPPPTKQAEPMPEPPSKPRRNTPSKASEEQPLPAPDDKQTETEPNGSDREDGQDGDPSIEEEPPTPPPPTAPPTGPVMKLAEQMPQFPGGHTAMLSYIFMNIRYPEKARDTGVEGKVYITFIVERDGAITDVKIKQDIGTGCGAEAARIVRAMPKWLPGRTGGKDVRVLMTLPIDFKLIDIE